ncbi:lasso peptide biosynthesis B2 protein [Actinosynnema sp. NPDC023587]|uniref:lasso peptide biosynthesis B2 protein n=1 Tax=Actinosynnema sp. NPDC023587 TaxID=3154695 RepID=UPI0033C1B1BC
MAEVGVTTGNAVHVPRHLHAAGAAGGSTFLLNARSGRWHVLNPVATSLWCELGRLGDVERVLDDAAGRYPDAVGDTARSDARRVIADMVERGLVVEGSGSPSRSRTGESPDGLLTTDHLPPVTGVRALAGLVVALVLLRLPFHFTLRVVGVLNRRWCARAATADEVMAAVAAVDAVADRHPGRAACLERSLAAVVTTALSRRRVRWVLGAADDPCRFHAWVESGGMMVGRTPDGSASAFIRVLAL